MNIDEQSASPELFINIHVIQPDSSSSGSFIQTPNWFYSISVSYHSFIVFYTVLEVGFSIFLTFMFGCVCQLLLNQHDDDDSVMASKRTITSEGKDKQLKTRVVVTMSQFPGE